MVFSRQGCEENVLFIPMIDGTKCIYFIFNYPNFILIFSEQSQMRCPSLYSFTGNIKLFTALLIILHVKPESGSKSINIFRFRFVDIN